MQRLSRQEINYSLGSLKECIRVQLLNLRTGKQNHVPYRNSKLTQLLRENLNPSLSDHPQMTTFIVHVSPMRSSQAHTRNTLEYMAAMIEISRAAQERKKFVGPEQWTREQVVDWVAQLDHGRFKRLAPSFQLTGKMLSVAWLGELIRRVEAAGGSEADCNYICKSILRCVASPARLILPAGGLDDAFHQELKKAKASRSSTGSLPVRSDEQQQPQQQPSAAPEAPPPKRSGLSDLKKRLGSRASDIST
jgi:hypothetical protein